MPHLLRCLFSVECFFLNNSLLAYHFFSHWILSVMRHQDPELHEVLRSGVWPQLKTMDLRPSLASDWFKSWPMSSGSNLSCTSLIPRWVKKQQQAPNGVMYTSPHPPKFQSCPEMWPTKQSEISWTAASEESERAGLKLSIKKTKIMVSGPITAWQIEGKSGSSDRFPLLGLQNHCGWWSQPWN